MALIFFESQVASNELSQLYMGMSLFLPLILNDSFAGVRNFG